MKLSTISPKQFEILFLLYRFRFLDRKQVQKILGHSDSKRTTSWLRDLTDKELVYREYSKYDTRSAVYCLQTRSKKLLATHAKVDKKLLTRVYREKERSETFVQHCLLVASIYLNLIEQSKTEGSVLHFYTRTDLSTYYYLPYKRPDAYFAFVRGEKVSRYFLEIIDPYTPRFVIRKRMQEYIEYFEDGEWTEKTGDPNPKMLIVCPSKRVLSYVNKYLDAVVEESSVSDVEFYLAESNVYGSS